MGLIQPYTDPVTGALYPSTYNVVADIQINFASQKVSIYANRYVSLTTYSQGLGPLLTTEIDITGTAYFTQALPVVTAQYNQYRQNLANIAQNYIAGLPTYSGITGTLPATAIA